MGSDRESFHRVVEKIMGERFRDSAWDSQLDTMLDDLQQSVQGGEETHGHKNGHGTQLAYTNGHGGQTSREYQERQVGNTREVSEKTTKTAGGAGEPYTYREESNFVSSTSSSSVPMGSKRAIQNGLMEQHIIDGINCNNFFLNNIQLFSE